MLVDEDGVPIGVHYDKAARSCCVFICFGLKLDTLRLELALEGAHIRQDVKLLGIAVPTRVEGQHVSFEHTFKETDRMVSVLQDQPFLRSISAEDREAQLLIE